MTSRHPRSSLKGEAPRQTMQLQSLTMYLRYRQRQS